MPITVKLSYCQLGHDSIIFLIRLYKILLNHCKLQNGYIIFPAVVCQMLLKQCLEMPVNLCMYTFYAQELVS